MFVKIYKLGEEEDAITSFEQGVHIIGRGADLQCSDKRVSRNHATLEVGRDDVKITSNHINPCFLKTASGKTVTILPKDASSNLNDGDTFALLPDMFWFKIRVIEEDAEADSTVKVDVNDEQSFKRPLNDVEEEVSEKRKKMDDEADKTENNMEPETTNGMLVEQEETGDNTNAAESSELATSPNDVKAEQEETGDITIGNPELSTSANDEQEQANNENPACDSTNDLPQGSTDKEEEQSDQQKVDDGTGPSTSDTRPKQRRERCWYGNKCYRKNPIHRDDFSHPGDSDFESDPDDSRPTCSFGGACYRKNKDHRRQYKHPPQQPPSKKKRTRKKVDRYNAGGGDAGEEELSELSEDPFMVDDDSDEYVEDSDGDDTDWEDSQNVDEDSENMKRLVKEANRFVKK